MFLKSCAEWTPRYSRPQDSRKLGLFSALQATPASSEGRTPFSEKMLKAFSLGLSSTAQAALHQCRMLLMNRERQNNSTIRKNSFIVAVISPISSSYVEKRYVSCVKYNTGRVFTFLPVSSIGIRMKPPRLFHHAELDF